MDELSLVISSFFFQAEDGIRDDLVTGVQTCALPIFLAQLIAQVAVLPAFGNARRNSKLAAIVSGDPVKREELRKKYDLEIAVPYEEYDQLLRSGKIDAVYIALPNSMHAEYSERAARAAIHVLCEKPMAVTDAECELMGRTARDNKVKLMVAYRLHFQRANLQPIEIARSRRIGQPRLFTP